MTDWSGALEDVLGRPVRLVQEEPRRHSTVYRVETGGQRLFVKQVRENGGTETAAARVRREYEVLELLWRAMPREERFGRVRPVACLPEHRLIVMEEVRGQTLNQVLRAHGRGWPSRRSLGILTGYMELLGRWVRAFQDVTRRPEDPAPYLDRLRSDVDDLTRVLEARPRVRFTGSLAEAVRARARAVAGRPLPAGVEVTGVSGELSPENMLVRDGRLTVVDFGMYAAGLSTSDPAMLYQHLSTLAYRPWFRPRSVRALQRAFLEGYGRPDWLADPLFALCRLRFKLSRMEAESGRKWPQFGVAQRLFYRRAWRLERREIAALVSAGA